MKKTIYVLAIALVLGAALPVRAEMEQEMMQGYCPMMAVAKAKELGLSKKQEAQIKKIKEDMWAQIKPIKQKSSSEVEGVLSAKQQAKYKELMSAKSPDGGSCGGAEKNGKSE